MPKKYIARLVYDRAHSSMVIVKKPLSVVGGITFRLFKRRKFAEIVFAPSRQISRSRVTVHTSCRI